MILEEMKSADVARVASHAVAVLPIAAIEQHGSHLAVSTDAAIITALAARVEARLKTEIMLCPTLQVGSSHHHLGFAGTLSLSPETYVLVLLDLCESLLSSGFRRIVLLNGHGGNIVPAQHALSILSQRHDDTLQPNIALATYWEMAGESFRGAPPMESRAISHACEYETSLMLHLYPQRVDLQNHEAAVQASSNAHINWQNETASRGVWMSKRFHFILSNGGNGNPKSATAEKGEHLLKRAELAVAEFLQDFSTWPFLDDLRASKL